MIIPVRYWIGWTPAQTMIWTDTYMKHRCLSLLTGDNGRLTKLMVSTLSFLHRLSIRTRIRLCTITIETGISHMKFPRLVIHFTFSHVYSYLLTVLIKLSIPLSLSILFPIFLSLSQSFNPPTIHSVSLYACPALIICVFMLYLTTMQRYAVASFVEALCYKPEGRKFYFDEVIGFSIDLILPTAL
jgi:hypothetical protein